MPRRKDEGGITLTHKQRGEYIQLQKEELIAKIGKAQATLLLQRVPKNEVRKRKLNPNNPNSPTFSYVEHGFISETLNWVTALNWDLVVLERERIGDQAIVHGYLEVRFKDVVIRKHASGGMKYIEKNRNMNWADAFNGATSKMLRAAAARLGLGLEFYRTEETAMEKAELEKVDPGQLDSNDPATTAQLEVLKKYGVKVPDGTTKGQARDLIKKAYQEDKKN